MKQTKDHAQTVRYVFRLEDGKEEVFLLSFDKRSMKLHTIPTPPYPHWVQLNFHQCPHCPLKQKVVPHCPAALALSGVINSFDGTNSYDPVHLTVETELRTVMQHTTAQRAIGSLMGLLIAMCDCPHSDFLRPMARFHLPLSDEIETLYRVTSMYLLAQYFVSGEGGTPDLELTGLVQYYEQLQQVNFGLADRLREATRTDSSINAIVCLDVFTRTVPRAIAAFLEEIKPLFRAYLNP